MARVRRAIREPRVGHIGTLDPLASGVLPLVRRTGHAAGAIPERRRKSYEAEIIRLGFATTT